MSDKKEYYPVVEMIRAAIEKKPIDFMEHYDAAMGLRMGELVEAYTQHLKETMFSNKVETLTLKEFLELAEEADEKDDDEDEKTEDKKKKKDDDEEDDDEEDEE